ncbi:hypothetical protein [Sphingomonas sp. TREG-RG-20F-R18-01]|uniref:hypothetical protein n=1 Tax=Sphingomonas sp. TREG-RG-20F-R18-01 TaxID=2914982 RepID=UPI001F587FC8|nr:hypothetical protein [Sphingomonas sp. TREG-RG-20F-R18-01]
MRIERITIQNIRDAGYCATGAKRWFAAHNLDFRDFMKNGIAVGDFLATGDGLAQIVVDKTEASSG